MDRELLMFVRDVLQLAFDSTDHVELPMFNVSFDGTAVEGSFGWRGVDYEIYMEVTENEE